MFGFWIMSEWIRLNGKGRPVNNEYDRYFYDLATRTMYNLPKFADIAVALITNEDLPPLIWKKFGRHPDTEYGKEIIEDFYKLKIFLVKEFLHFRHKMFTKPKKPVMTSVDYFIDRGYSFNNLFSQFQKYEAEARRYFQADVKKLDNDITKVFQEREKKHRLVHQEQFSATLDAIKFFPGIGVEFHNAMDSFESIN